MKKLNLLLVILIGITILSCSSDNNNSQLSQSELLTQNSPWTFDHYEMINIIDAGNSTMTQQEIENNVNTTLVGQTLTFNQDGSGSTFSPNEGTDTWQWVVINNNQLKITYDNSNGEYDTYNNLSVTSSELKIEYQSVTYDSNASYEVLHNGKFYFE